MKHGIVRRVIIVQEQEVLTILAPAHRPDCIAKPPATTDMSCDGCAYENAIDLLCSLEQVTLTTLPARKEASRNGTC